MAKVTFGDATLSLLPRGLFEELPPTALRGDAARKVGSRYLPPRSMFGVDRWDAADSIGFDLAAHGGRDFYETVVAAKVRQLLAGMARQQEAVLEDFLVSGAMPRDLRTEESFPYVETTVDVSGRGYRLVARQQWRVV